MDVDPIDFSENRPSSRRQIWMILTGIIIAGTVVGIAVVAKHRRDLAEAVYEEPFATAVVERQHEFLEVGYAGRRIGNRYCVDFGELRLVCPASVGGGRSTMSGSIVLRNGMTISSDLGGSSWGLKFYSKDASADVTLGPVNFRIRSTKATIDGTDYDLETPTVIVFDETGSIEEVRNLRSPTTVTIATEELP